MSNILRFGKKNEQNVPKDPSQNPSTPSETMTFEEIVRRNLENAERVRREREKANKNVLRSYRIK